MFAALALLSSFAMSPLDTIPAELTVDPGWMSGAIETQEPVNDTTPRRRPRAIAVSDAYAKRLHVHRFASYAILPLFTAQAIVGEHLYHSDQNGLPPAASLKRTHYFLAYSIGGLFAVNGVTGAMNWWETRHNPKGRAWRTAHGALMMLSEAGFAYTASLGWKARFSQSGGNVSRTNHLHMAELSVGMALTSYAMMLKPFRRD